jgi:hypothetical protein
MSIEQINPGDVVWPDEREPYVPRHRSERGITWMHGVNGPSPRIGRHDARHTGRDTLADWQARHGLAEAAR